MEVAVISDLHDNVVGWQIIAKELAKRNITTLINCGDTCSPVMLQTIAKSFPGDIHTVFGNVADRERESQRVKELPNVTHYGDQADFTLDGKKIAVTHLPAQAKKLVESGAYDLVCHGHDHLKRQTKIGNTLLVDPGTAGGMFQYPSFAIVDLETMQATLVDIKL